MVRKEPLARELKARDKLAKNHDNVLLNDGDDVTREFKHKLCQSPCG
jgi:hypothetical protein